MLLGEFSHLHPCHAHAHGLHTERQVAFVNAVFVEKSSEDEITATA